MKKSGNPKKPPHNARGHMSGSTDCKADANARAPRNRAGLFQNSAPEPRDSQARKRRAKMKTRKTTAR